MALRVPEMLHMKKTGDRTSSYVVRPRLVSTPRAISRAKRWFSDRLHSISVPLRWRFALFSAAIVSATVAIFSVIVYLFAENSLYNQQDNSLRAAEQQLLARIQAFGLGGGPGRFYSDLRSGNAFFELLGPSGQPILANVEVNGSWPTIPARLIGRAVPDRGTLDDATLSTDLVARIDIRQIVYSDGTTAGYLVILQPVTGIVQQLATLRLYLSFGSLLSVLAVLGVSWVVAGRALRPIDEVAKAAEDIGRTQDLSRRIQIGRSGDEVGRLQIAFNDMLEKLHGARIELQDAYGRLRDALASQRQFIADASHELRTPLTSIRSNVGQLLQRPDMTPRDRKAALEDVHAESERMSRMVHDLLTLARADAGQHLTLSAVNLEPIVSGVVRRAQALTRRNAKHVILVHSTPAYLQGNADSLTQLLWILIDNGLKHGGPQVTVELSLQSQSGQIELQVADDGPGIQESTLDQIFTRFYRADSSRAGEGTGLGLAIARWVVQEHHGQISAGNGFGGGAVFTVFFPAIVTDHGLGMLTA